MPVLCLTLDWPGSFLSLLLGNLETFLRLSCGEMLKPHGEILEDERVCVVRGNEA